MDDLSVIEARREACTANLRRALGAPVRDDLPTAFAQALRRLSEQAAPRGPAVPSRAEG